MLRFSVYVTPDAVDGPVFVYVTDALTVLPATAVGGTETEVVTSASGEIAVVSRAESAFAFAPWLVDVAIVANTLTAPLAGAV